VRNRSLLWDKHEIAAAELRHAIIGIVLRKAVEDNPKDLELTRMALGVS
jgi:light-regulated signal transduction histidine kinase (bacteriophytochrome)